MNKTLGNSHRTEKERKEREKKKRKEKKRKKKENKKKKGEKREFIISPAEFIPTMTKAFLRRDGSLIAHHFW